MKGRGWGFWVLLFLLTVLVIGGSVFVGYHVRADNGRFNWELTAVVGTALGTTFLAVITGFLGFETSRDVQASREIAVLTREDRLARERPIVIVQRVSVTVEQVAHRAELELELRNLGEGPAVRGAVEVALVMRGTDLARGRSFPKSLAASEVLSCTITLPVTQAPPEGYRGANDWVVAGAFVDLVGCTHRLLDGQAVGPDERVEVVAPPDDLIR